MNHQGQPYVDVHQSHMAAAQPHTPQPGSSGGMPHHYSQYGQPPILHPGSGNYSPAQASFNGYNYQNGVTSPQSVGHPPPGSMVSSMGSQMLPLPAMSQAGQPHHGATGVANAGYAPHPNFDSTGQVAPHGMKPRVTATLWEDEGSLCFQVEAKGVCVARREDNHMINGTKLLNVAGMTRGRRDGILKSEKLRHVVKIGPMHLKGVWIPYERALDFANKEKITELLYPLFVHNIGALLYHPANQHHTSTVMQAAERRRGEQGMQEMRDPQGPQASSMHHHHLVHTTGASQPGSTQMTPHSNMGRPSLDRAHTFPTPPTSASIMGIGGQENTFGWGNQNMNNVQHSQPLSIETGLTNARSMPATPATTPPGASLQSMSQYSGGQQAYDQSRSMYSTTPGPQQPQYVPQGQTVAQQNMARFGQPMQSAQYTKGEMGPPSSRGGVGTSHDGDGAHDLPKSEVLSHQNPGNEQVGHGAGEEEAEHEHDVAYPAPPPQQSQQHAHHAQHDDSASYNAHRGPYHYANSGPAGSLGGEHPHLSPEISGSPNHHTAPSSGRATPRNASTSQWPSNYAASSSSRQGPSGQAPASSNLYSVMSNDHSHAHHAQNHAERPQGGEGYSSQTAGYPSQQSQPQTTSTNSTGTGVQQAPQSAPAVVSAPIMNGVSSSNKRVREYDEDAAGGLSRPISRGAGAGAAPESNGIEGLKRRKTIREEQPTLPGLTSGGAGVPPPPPMSTGGGIYDREPAAAAMHQSRAAPPIGQRRR